MATPCHTPMLIETTPPSTSLTSNQMFPLLSLVVSWLVLTFNVAAVFFVFTQVNDDKMEINLEFLIKIFKVNSYFNCFSFGPIK
jgi:hypothetical protein